MWQQNLELVVFFCFHRASDNLSKKISKLALAKSCYAVCTNDKNALVIFYSNKRQTSFQKNQKHFQSAKHLFTEIYMAQRNCLSWKTFFLFEATFWNMFLNFPGSFDYFCLCYDIAIYTEMKNVQHNKKNKKYSFNRLAFKWFLLNRKLSSDINISDNIC